MKYKKSSITISLLLCNLFSWGCCVTEPKIKIQRPVFFALMVENCTTKQIIELSLLAAEQDTASKNIKQSLNEDVIEQYEIFKMQEYRYNHANYSQIAKIYLTQQKKACAYKSKKNAPINIDPLLDALAESFLKAVGPETVAFAYLEETKDKNKHQQLFNILIVFVFMTYYNLTVRVYNGIFYCHRIGYFTGCVSRFG